MDRSTGQTITPWLPLTFRGVGSLAWASRGRFWGWTALMIAFVTVASVWLVARVYLPGFDNAVRHLPGHVGLEDGMWRWDGPSSQSLHRSRFFEIRVDLGSNTGPTDLADLTLLVQRETLALATRWGRIQVPYPSTGEGVRFDRLMVQAWWGAWRPFVLLSVAVLILTGVAFIWMGLATIYALGLRLVVFYTDRDVRFSGCWQLANAAWFPGALVGGLALLFYGEGRLSLTALLAVAPLPILLSWVYLVGGAVHLPRLLDGGARANPFAGPGSRENPFAPPGGGGVAQTGAGEPEAPGRDRETPSD